MKKHLLIYLPICLFAYLLIGLPALAGPSSSHFELKDYQYSAGGSDASMSSANYKAFGTVGEVEYGSPSSAHYNAGSGLIYTMMANVPPAPTLSNPGTNYDRLKFVLSQGGNASDTTYAIEISTDKFVSDIRYIKSDDTVGSTLTTADYQTYTVWGGASGAYVTGLLRNTTYYIRAKARQGIFTETPWGPISTGVSTSDPSLTFGVDSSTVTFSNLNAGNSYTDSSKTTVLTTSTNAYNGYVVNARETGALTATGFGSILDFASPNSAPTTWSGTGFGYTTNDNNLTGGTPDRFTNGGPKFAGFTTSSPGDPVADHPGPVLSPISSEQFTITYRVTADQNTKAAKYSTTVLYVVVPSY